MPDLIPPAYFDTVMDLARTALRQSGEDAAVRRKVNALRLQMVKAERGAILTHPNREALSRQVGALSQLLGVADGPAARAGRRKRGVDPIRAMVASGTLEKVHAEAAEEIAAMMAVLDSALGLKAMPLGPRIGSASKGHGRYLAPIERLSVNQQRLWDRRYRPWSLWAAHIAVGALDAQGRPHHDVSLFQLTIDVVLYGTGCRAYDRVLRRKSGTAAGYLQESLHRYAVLAGWVEPKPWMAPTTKPGG